ncbi:MAG: O-antigen ligase family protein [Acidobacteria bacterium]|nr:O-antigen ligase family protein [Acidobacteriota bacterium]
MPVVASQFLNRPLWLSDREGTPTAVLTGLSAVSIIFSIAVSQIFLGGALLALLLARRRLEFPARLGIPLLAFLGWTLLALAASADPMSGLSQVRRIFVFLVPLVVYNAFRRHEVVWRTLQAVVVMGSLAALYGLGQFGWDYWRLSSQGLPFYENYVARQITGFMSHWMTFSGQLMLVFLLLSSMLFFFRQERRARWRWVCFVLLGLALAAAFTRGVWLATGVGMVYLLGRFQRRLLWLLPLGILCVYLVSPAWLQKRQFSIFDWRTDASNQARLVMLQTGLRMVAAHLWLGLGPEQVWPQFLLYKPPELPLPRAWYGHLHNTYLQIAAERGIPGLVFLLWFFGEILRRTWLLAGRPSAQERALGHAGFAITVGMMVEGLFEYNFGDSEVLMLYLFLVSAVYSWEKLSAPAPSPQPTSAAGAAVS